MWVVNGFYGSMRAKFTSTELNPNGILWMKLSWDEADLSWETFRNDIIGATDCTKAAPSKHSISTFRSSHVFSTEVRTIGSGEKLMRVLLHCWSRQPPVAHSPPMGKSRAADTAEWL